MFATLKNAFAKFFLETASATGMVYAAINAVEIMAVAA
jgi:hypothetical protein